MRLFNLSIVIMDAYQILQRVAVRHPHFQEDPGGISCAYFIWVEMLHVLTPHHVNDPLQLLRIFPSKSYSMVM